jgi:hypothetical protein
MAQQIEGIELQAVIHLNVGRDELRRRLLGRAGQEGRADDMEATIDHRLRVYDAETAPLLDFYARRGLIVEVNGDQHPDKVFADTSWQPSTRWKPKSSMAPCDSIPRREEKRGGGRAGRFRFDGPPRLDTAESTRCRRFWPTG